MTVFDRKVYVSVYADGPTRVLCFSDDALLAGSSEADEAGDTQALLSRLHHLTRQLLSVDRQLELYQGAASGLRSTRASRAVPAMLLLHQGSLTLRGAGSLISGAGDVWAAQRQGQQQQLPLVLQGGAAGGWLGSSTTAAAVALLQQMERQQPQQTQPQQLQGAAATQPGPGRSSVTRSVDPATWAGASAATAAGVGSTGSQQQGPPGTVRLVSPAATAGAAPTHVSSRAQAGAAAAAGAGVHVTGGLLGAEEDMDAGLKLYYDKLTLMLDSGLPLGGNVKVRVRV